MLTPNSGVRQGCPLSPTLSLMLISPIVRKQQQVSGHVTVLLYVDDLLIIISGNLDFVVATLQECWMDMLHFQNVTGTFSVSLSFYVT